MTIERSRPSGRRSAVLTLLALAAFAANSLLCRAALRDVWIDPLSFTALRLVSGALLLGAVISVREGGPRALARGSWLSAAALFGYALAFSLAYVAMEAGTGALLLFGAVQVTMYAAGLAAGERPSAIEWLGLASASAGLVWLVLPGLEAPPLSSALLMGAAGACWGVYSLRAPAGPGALKATGSAFLRGLPLVLAILLAVAAFGGALRVTPRGAALALLSGALASGLGYVVWYAALRTLRTTHASLVQLAVPLLAGAGGVLLLGERLTARLALAALAILGGIAAALLFRTSRN